MHFPDRGCVRTLRTLYVYATGEGKEGKGASQLVTLSTRHSPNIVIADYRPICPLQLTVTRWLCDELTVMTSWPCDELNELSACVTIWLCDELTVWRVDWLPKEMGEGHKYSTVTAGKKRVDVRKGKMGEKGSLGCDRFGHGPPNWNFWLRHWKGWHTNTSNWLTTPTWTSLIAYCNPAGYIVCLFFK